LSTPPKETVTSAQSDAPGWQRHARNRLAALVRRSTTHKVYRDTLPVAKREFALFAAASALLLLFLLPVQTTWVDGSKLYEQPAFWPAISIVAMVVFAAGLVWQAVRSKARPGLKTEVWFWLRSLEFVIWFLAYVWLVPIIGYLTATILLACILGWRVGYRHPKWMALAAVFGLAVVVLFKATLGVNIPAGALYDMLPSGDFRSFLMTNF